MPYHPQLRLARRVPMFNISTLVLLGSVLLLIGVPGACGRSDDEADGSNTATTLEAPTPVPMMAIVTPTPNSQQVPGDGGAVEEPPDDGSAQVGAAGVYVVQQGDTLYGIATRLGLDLATLGEANGITDPASIQVGQVLVIPSQ